MTTLSRGRLPQATGAGLRAGNGDAAGPRSSVPRGQLT